LAAGGQPFGPGNPHPLSTLTTELVWEGKYDEYGNRREVDATGLAMPLQRIETVDEPRVRTEAQGGLFDAKKAHLDDFRNMLVWGDNKLVLASLLEDFRGKVDLIYIDPPFDVGADFSMSVPIGDEQETAEKDQSALEMVAYRDTWGKGVDSYLQMMFERLSPMRDLISDRGSIWVHCDWRMNSNLRLLLDEVMGAENYFSEIIWRRSTTVGSSKAVANRFPTLNDSILVYYKSESERLFHKQYIPPSDEYKARFRATDERGSST
jgi:adenine specific DNA methylase Mod